MKNRNRRIFVVIFLAFTLLIVMLTVDMASRTTAPWNRKKQAARALPGNQPEDKSLLIDTTGLDSMARIK